MKWTLKHTDPSLYDVDVLISFCWKGDQLSIPDVPPLLTKSLRDAAEREGFIGEKESTLVFMSHREASAYKIVIIGLGEKKEFSQYELQTCIASACAAVCKQQKPKTIAIIPVKDWLKDLDASSRLRSIVEGVELSQYLFTIYKQKKEDPLRFIEQVLLWMPAGKMNAAHDAILQGSARASATCFARDMVNEPPMLMSPSHLGMIAKRIEKETKGEVKVRIYEQSDIEKFSMGAFLGVSQGSPQPPVFIQLRYVPKHPKKHLVLIGKGITFDTGGLSLKSAEHMETMKMDMAGAAAVLSVFRALPDLAPEISVTGLIAACENMPSGSAMKPGDIVKAMNGKTIEVLNTDAEGRLTLADMLSYAILKEKSHYIIDLATLTGACMIALGTSIAGLWSNHEQLGNVVETSAQEAGELVWRMPLPSHYLSLMKSNVADIKNIQTGRYGGAITAALFLSQFVGETPWVHLDIAGPSFSDHDHSLHPKGGTGFGVRLLLQTIRTLSQHPI